MSVLCCLVEVSALGCRGVLSSVLCLVCDREASIMRRPWSTGGCCAIGKKISIVIRQLIYH